MVKSKVENLQNFGAFSEYMNFMKNMDKGFTVPKWVLISWPKILQMLQTLSAQIVYPRPKILDFNEKKASLGVRSPLFIACALNIRALSFAKAQFTTDNVP